MLLPLSYRRTSQSLAECQLKLLSALIVENFNDDNENDITDEDKFREFKTSPKQIFCSFICQVCKVNLSRYFLCNECKMVSYCKEEHLKIDYLNHKGLCMAIKLIAKRRGSHVYNMAGHLNAIEFRNLRLHTIYLCEQFLNRSLANYEREIFLFPRLCHEVTCREWKSQLLSDCEKCGHVSFCNLHPLNENHKKFCNAFALYQRIILHEKSYGVINVALPQKILKRTPTLCDDVKDTMRLLYKNITAFQDDCINSALMEIATAPLTIFYACQKMGLEFKEQMVIHFVGAEMQFEANKLDKWESIFFHLITEISDLHIVFIGSELNEEKLPVEIISRTRMCKTCRLNYRGIRFDFQCKKFYHDYCNSLSYTKPDIVCFLNPALYRPGYRGFDTWPRTIDAAIKTSSPVLITSLTENECYLDFERIKYLTNDEFEILLPPLKNPYASTRPERNFSTDEDVPLTFKNNFLFAISKIKDLIEF
ncbi:hypothetical protein PVAND_001207 [Polypedilum vanderplanki]|uniref:MYND-type domain-containing protein n=1 Tax=Polypedilum vanderplanki TaxID=319348 RepID=A0A9J6BM88_POLVA|nr:hypothetical protein PVAND_001207 [Polypedilum vanderplanki]